MKYLIVDYCRGCQNISKTRKLLKHFRIYKQFEKYQKLKQLKVTARDVNLCEMEFRYITVEMLPNQLAGLSAKKVTAKLQVSIGGGCLFAVEPQLQEYVPKDISWCSDRDEIYVNMLETALKEYKTSGKVQLLFLDDGTKDAAYYIRKLSVNQNYVRVISNRHEELESVYRHLYEEEGLMVQCVGYKEAKLRAKTLCLQEDGCILVVDLTSDWKGIHHLYPKGAYVLDVTFSHEKEAYLTDKGLKLKKYCQMAVLGGR